MTCDWKRPPRYTEDVLPAVRAFYNSNKTGKPIPVLKNTLDLIFTRRPTPPGKNTQEYEIFDGHRLVPIWKYLIRHPRPDLIQLDKRMEWLSMGPYGNRSGDILLLTRSGLNRPIEKRYYFSAPYYSWHGSACEQDGHIPFILAQANGSGQKMRSILNKFGGASPSEREMTPLVVSIFGK